MGIENFWKTLVSLFPTLDESRRFREEGKALFDEDEACDVYSDIMTFLYLIAAGCTSENERKRKQKVPADQIGHTGVQLYQMFMQGFRQQMVAQHRGERVYQIYLAADKEDRKPKEKCAEQARRDSDRVVVPYDRYDSLEMCDDGIIDLDLVCHTHGDDDMFVDLVVKPQLCDFHRLLVSRHLRHVIYEYFWAKIVDDDWPPLVRIIFDWDLQGPMCLETDEDGVKHISRLEDPAKTQIGEAELSVLHQLVNHARLGVPVKVYTRDADMLALLVYHFWDRDTSSAMFPYFIWCRDNFNPSYASVPRVIRYFKSRDWSPSRFLLLAAASGTDYTVKSDCFDGIGTEFIAKALDKVYDWLPHFNPEWRKVALSEEKLPSGNPYAPLSVHLVERWTYAVHQCKKKGVPPIEVCGDKVGRGLEVYCKIKPELFEKFYRQYVWLVNYWRTLQSTYTNLE